MGLLDEFKSRNFSLYAQWLGVISIVLLIVLGVVSLASNPIFAIIGCDGFIARFENAYYRGAAYIIFSIVMFLSTLINKTILILPAVTLLFTFICYVIAGVKKQPHASTKILGGTGVDNVV
ncbi:hypothetical protein [Parasitella parasitica]|uniref:Uncharacterized protein n=1 Tax=Parasitella parasitica TaxID=35722 RepID=A0A0B7NPS4_9FUNG|nr:hypothetical protein [Parasitella parasitica]